MASFNVHVDFVVSGENLVPEPQVQDETGATGEGHARGPSRGGRGQRAVIAKAGGRARAGPGRQTVHQPAAGCGRRKGRTNGAAVVLTSTDARTDAQNVVVTAVVVMVIDGPVLSSYIHVHIHIIYIYILQLYKRVK